MSSCTVLLNTKHVAVEPGLLTSGFYTFMLLLHISLLQFFEEQVYNTCSHQTSVSVACVTLLVTYLALLIHILSAVTESCNTYIHFSKVIKL